MLDPTTYRGKLRSDVEALVGVGGSLDLEVPTCPGWTQRDLVVHTGRIHRWATECLRSEPDQRVRRPRGPGSEVDPRGWLREAADEALDTMAAVDLNEPVYTWAGVRPGAWWLRRLAHETAVHRWDGESSVGAADAFDAGFAADGIDEYLSEFVDAWGDLTEMGPVRSTVQLVALDHPGRWHIDADADRVLVEHGDRPSDVTVRASTSDLVLLLWKRRALGGLDVVGDIDAFDRWQRVVTV